MNTNSKLEKTYNTSAWTAKEDKQLLELMNCNTSISMICRTLKRKEKSVTYRYNFLIKNVDSNLVKVITNWLIEELAQHIKLKNPSKEELDIIKFNLSRLKDKPYKYWNSISNAPIEKWYTELKKFRGRAKT